MPHIHSHDHDDGHDHHHHHHGKCRFFQTKTFRLITMLILTFLIFIAELVVGNITRSVTLVADAFHMLSDVISLGIGIFAVRIVKRRTNINTFGWVRAEVVGANINTVFLLALCLTIIFDAIRRFIEPEPIENVDLLLIVGGVGLGINLIGLALFQGFHGHSHGGTKPKEKKDQRNDQTLKSFRRHSTRALEEVISECAEQADEHHSDVVIEMNDNKTKSKRKKASMNMHGVFLHVFADTLGSVVVIISGLIIKYVPHDPENKKHWTVYIDPVLSVIIVIIIAISTIPLFRDTTAILLQTIPKNLQIQQVKTDLLEKVPEISSIHELHIWRLTDEKIIASAHLCRKTLTNYMLVAEKVKKFFHSIGIHSITIQYEIEDHSHNNSNNHQQELPLIPENMDSQEKVIGDCRLRCDTDTCDTRTCCTIKLARSDTLLNKNPIQISTVTEPHGHENSSQTFQIAWNDASYDEKF